MMHLVAKLHYESDMSQVEIARKLDVSTATISRLLNKARAAGIVRIEVVGLSSPEDMTSDLVKRLGLKQAYVVDAPPGNVLGALATPLSSLLQDAGLGSGSVLGIGWGRAVREVTLAFFQQAAVQKKVREMGMEPPTTADSATLETDLQQAYQRQAAQLKAINYQPQ